MTREPLAFQGAVKGAAPAAEAASYPGSAALNSALLLGCCDVFS